MNFTKCAKNFSAKTIALAIIRIMLERCKISPGGVGVKI
jgi:hypothetical protein